MNNELNKLPPPPKGQTGLKFDELNSLPPPPKGQQGMTLEEITGKPQQSRGILDKNDPIRNFGIGFAKKTASTLQNIGSVIAKPLGNIMGVPEGQIGIPEDKLQLDNKAQEIGGVASDIASFAAPGSKIGALTKGASLATKIATEGVLGGVTTAAQSGEFNTESRDAAILSAIFPAAGKAFEVGKKLTQPAQKELASRVVNSLIKPLAKDLSYAKNPGRAVAEMGITANSLEELATKVSSARNKIGTELSGLYEKSKALVSVEDALNPIDEAIAQANKAPRTNASLISRLQGLKEDLLGVQINEAGETVVTRNLKDIPAKEAFDFKKDIGALTKFTGNASDDNTVNGALKRVYGSIKGKLDKAVPESTPLNEKYADLTSAEVATKYRDKIAERQNLVKFDLKATGGTTALITALATGGAALPTVLVGLGAAGAQKALESPRAKTEFAKWLAGASPADRKVLFEKAPWAKGLILELLTQED